MNDTYGIHHWKIPWSSYRKLAWVGFEPRTAEFRSDALTDWAIRPWVQLTLRASFVQLIQFHCWFSVMIHFGYCFHQSPGLFEFKFAWGNHMGVAEWMIRMVSPLKDSLKQLQKFGLSGIWTRDHRLDALSDWVIK